MPEKTIASLRTLDTCTWISVSQLQEGKRPSEDNVFHMNECASLFERAERLSSVGIYSTERIGSKSNLGVWFPYDAD